GGRACEEAARPVRHRVEEENRARRRAGREVEVARGPVAERPAAGRESHGRTLPAAAEAMSAGASGRFGDFERDGAPGAAGAEGDRAAGCAGTEEAAVVGAGRTAELGPEQLRRPARRGHGGGRGIGLADEQDLLAGGSERAG